MCITTSQVTKIIQYLLDRGLATRDMYSFIIAIIYLQSRYEGQPGQWRCRSFIKFHNDHRLGILQLYYYTRLLVGVNGQNLIYSIDP